MRAVAAAPRPNQSRSMATSYYLAVEIVLQAQNLRGYLEDMKARSEDEARAIIDFIDAVDAYNLRND